MIYNFDKNELMGNLASMSIPEQYTFLNNLSHKMFSNAQEILDMQNEILSNKSQWFWNESEVEKKLNENELSEFVKSVVVDGRHFLLFSVNGVPVKAVARCNFGPDMISYSSFFLIDKKDIDKERLKETTKLLKSKLTVSYYDKSSEYDRFYVATGIVDNYYEVLEKLYNGICNLIKI